MAIILDSVIKGVIRKELYFKRRATAISEYSHDTPEYMGFAKVVVVVVVVVDVNNDRFLDATAKGCYDMW